MDVRFVDVPAGVTGGRSHNRISPSFCGAFALIFLARRFSRSFPSSTVKSNFVTNDLD